MKQVTFLFATGTTWMDYLVTKVTKSRWSHVALRFDADNILLEALAGRGIILQPGEKYDGWSPSLSVSKQVEETVYDAMLWQSRQWAASNTSYGYGICLAIGVKEMFGLQAGRVALKWLAGRNGQARVCSEVLVALWRMAARDFMSECESRLISPDELYQALTSDLSHL